MSEHTAVASGIEIAIIGMAGRFPGADDIDTYWRNIRDGVESVESFSQEQLQQFGVSTELLDDPDYVRAGVRFDGFDQFDAGLFGYTPRDAEMLDPQQRIFLECAWSALEHAGCDPQRCPGAIGVYAGDGPNLYLLRHLLPAFGLGEASHIADLLGLMSGNAAGSLATRAAYKLNLRGPAMGVQTACSTSLTAVHLACQSLLSHDCDMALAGGVWLNLLQQGGYRYQPGAILSPDGHCRAFDAKAAGTLIGSGAGIVVLKRLDDAIADGDCIHAVIKGSAANNDGDDKVGFTAPSVSGQANVIRAAHVIADVPADSIGYIEAHGTGTTLGDPIEIAALTQAFRMSTPLRSFCAIGSVKTNIGHLDAAAGVAGLIKTVLALKHKTLPPSLHFEQPNPAIDFSSSPFFVCTQAVPWPRGDTPRRAGVSAFGIGGTNVHVVLEEAPLPISAAGSDNHWQVLPISAKTPGALMQACAQMAAYLRENSEQSPGDIAHTLQTGRREFPCRGAVVANSVAMAAELLSAPMVKRVPSQAPEVVFLFPGGGAQHVDMGAALYQSSAIFREQVDYCCDFLKREMDIDIRQFLFASADASAAADGELGRMDIAQPALFIIEYAMARWWMRGGVKPALMLGHSLGEYVAACLAGVFSREDALRIVAMRGRLMRTLAPGVMTAIALSEADLASYLVAGCDIAAINADALCVLSGALDAITQVEQRLREHGHLPRRLHVAIASHSALVEPITAQLAQVIASVPRHAPQIPWIANVTGKPITAAQAVSPDYWAQHLRSTVRFADGLDEIFAVPGRVLLEVGPGETLTALARQYEAQYEKSHRAEGIWASQAHPQQSQRNAQQLAQAIAGLWTAGVELDWQALGAGVSRHKIALPTYPFQRQRYWIDAAPATAVPAATAAVGDTSPYFYVPVWRRTSGPDSSMNAAVVSGCTLLLGGDDALSRHLQDLLRARGETVVLVTVGEEYACIDAQRYVIGSASPADFARLIDDVEAIAPIARVFHLWSLDGTDAVKSFASIFESGFLSVMVLAQVLGRAAQRKVAVLVVTDRMEDVAGIEPVVPEKSTVLGIARVLGQEYPQIACRVVDVVLPAADGQQVLRLARGLVSEIADKDGPFLVAYRGPQRWIKSYEKSPLHNPRPRLRRGGVYLITGGLGGVGLALARYLGKGWQAKLVLVGRTPLPERTAWENLIADVAQPPTLRRRLQQLLALEAGGVALMTIAADVTSREQMAAIRAQVHERFGAINGVIHAVVHPERGMIAQRQRDDIAAAFAPKIDGTRLLLDELRAESLDFVLLCSSVASIIGGLGRSDYAAANAFLDAFALAQRRVSELPVFAVNWDAWRDVGIAQDMQLPAGVGLDEQSGVLAFERIVNGPDHPQVIVSAAPFEQRLRALDDDMLALLETAPDTQPSAPPAKGHSRPLLQNIYVAPDGPLQQGIADIWSGMLGIAGIGVQDNLFELGGDSLLAIRLLAQVRKVYGVELHPADFFRNPTIAELAIAIETRLIDELERDAEESLPA